MKITNLYSDYEGYPEIVLTEESSSGEIIFKVQLLELHFYEILSFIPLGEYNPDSVMYNYFRAPGWHDDKWECKRLREFYDQLTLLSDLVPSDDLDVYNATKQICNSALQNENKLFIVLD
jgi:hypothetical protein